MSDVLVVGAGIAGASVAREAGRRGLSVTVLDPEPEHGASRAGLCLIRRRWHAGEDRRRSEVSIEEYKAIGALVADEAVVSSTKRFAHLEKDWFLVDPQRALVLGGAMLMPHRVRSVDPEGGTVRLLQDVAPMSARLVVLAAGPTTANILGLPAGAKLAWGHTAYSADAAVEFEAGIRVHWARPYHALIAVHSGGETRVGSSVSPDATKSNAQGRALLAETQEAGLVTPGAWSWRSGLRVMHDAFTGTGEPRWLSRRMVVLTGFARCGYGLAPARAREVLDRAFA